MLLESLMDKNQILITFIKQFNYQKKKAKYTVQKLGRIKFE